MKCEEMEGYLLDVLEGEEIDPDARAHLEVCGACRRRVDDIKQLWMGMDQVPTMNERVPEPPESIREDLEALDKIRQWSPPLIFAALVLAILPVAFEAAAAWSGANHSHVFLSLAASAMLTVAGVICLRQGLKLSGMSFRSAIEVLVAVGLGLVAYGIVYPLAVQGADSWMGPFDGWSHGARCFSAEIMLAAPLLFLTGLVIRRARFPTPLSILTLGGGIGLFSAAVTEAFCPNISSGHILVYHVGGVVVLAAVAAVVGKIVTAKNLKVS